MVQVEVAGAPGHNDGETEHVHCHAEQAQAEGHQQTTGVPADTCMKTTKWW